MKSTNFNPAPNSREKGRGVHNGDDVERLGVVRGSESRSFLQVTAQRPQRAQRRILKVDYSRRRGYRR